MCLILFLVREEFATCVELCDEVIQQETACAEFLCESDFCSASDSCVKDGEFDPHYKQVDPAFHSSVCQ